MEEYFDVLNENGEKIGIKKLRNEVHKDGDWHRTVHIWIYNDNKEILLQRRCPNKDSFPNMLDISSAGHVSAGDSSMEAAIREVKEEINIDIKKEDLFFIQTLKHSLNYKEDFINNQFEDIYIMKTNKTIKDMVFQKEEISEIFFIELKKLKKLVFNQSKTIVPRDEEYHIIFNYLDSIN